MYEHLIKPLSAARSDREEKESSGPENPQQKIRLNGREHLEGMNLTFSWSIHRSSGDRHAGLKPHIHPYPECLYFTGLNTANAKYLGAEIEIRLGEEQESYLFNDPTAVVIPAGLPHGPVMTRKLFSPRGFGFFTAGLSDESNTRWIEPPNGRAVSDAPARKYAHLIKPLRSGLTTERRQFVASRFTPEQLAAREKMTRRTGFKSGPGDTDHLIWMYGRDLENLDINIAWGFSSSPGIWHRGMTAHAHPEDEALIYLGTDPDNSDYLGAEIEIDLGKEHERYLFDKPTVVLCPAGLMHGPMVTRWVDRPFAFLLINLAGDMTMSFE
ncbi:MAG TPA: hypothetical protein VLL97_04745 [Acidobacteriota bacterium]|nr:hypothetical protein [Acidobacteriota bacterium]